MCYSGKCFFEDHMGDCRCYDYDLYQKIVKRISGLNAYSSCFLGGSVQCQEEDDCLELAIHNLTYQYLKQRAHKSYFLHSYFYSLARRNQYESN